MLNSKRRQLVVLLLQLMCLVDTEIVVSSNTMGHRIRKPYLNARFNPDIVYKVNDTSVIEFWPGYRPLSEWLIIANDRNAMNISTCEYDFEIGIIPFSFLRFQDASLRRMKNIPAMKFRGFYSKDLSYLFDSPPAVASPEPHLEVSCRFDTVYLDPPYRYYGYIGSRQMVYDSHWDTVHIGYSPIPFVRHIDTVYRVPNTSHHKIFTGHDWYYLFDMYTESLLAQGYVNYLWPKLHAPLALNGVDSILVAPNNQSICRFVHDVYQCDSQSFLYPIAYVFENGQDIKTPIRASFHVPFSTAVRNVVALLDSDDQIWVYQYNAEEDRYRFLYKSPLCQYLLFGKLPCCAQKNSLDMFGSGSGSGEDSDWVSMNNSINDPDVKILNESEDNI